MTCKPSFTPLFALALACAAATACTGDAGNDDGGNDTDEPQWPMAQSDAERELNPDLAEDETASIAADQQALAVDLYHALRNDPFDNGENFSVSSYSVAAAFGMLYGGTVGEARAQMESTLHFSLADERQYAAHNWLDQQLASRNLEATDDGMGGGFDPVIVQTANGVWVQETLGDSINPDYLDLLAINYGAGVHLADFATNSSGEEAAINRWVSARTHELIPKLLPPKTITPGTTMVLINALYLKAPWVVPFEEGSTEKAPFTKLNGETTDVDMMYQYALAGSYAETEDYAALAIPLRGSALEVVFVVPNDFASFEASLDQPTLDALLTGMQYAVVETSIPRLDLETDVSLVKTLKVDLGMPAPFEDGSSFDDIMPGLGVITKVIHKTVIKIDEKGTEAAAATAIVVGDDGGEDFPEVTFRADKPFFLMIRDEPTQSVLFFGRVLDPDLG